MLKTALVQISLHSRCSAVLLIDFPRTEVIRPRSIRVEIINVLRGPVLRRKHPHASRGILSA